MQKSNKRYDSVSFQTVHVVTQSSCTAVYYRLLSVSLTRVFYSAAVVLTWFFAFSETSCMSLRRVCRMCSVWVSDCCHSSECDDCIDTHAVWSCSKFLSESMALSMDFSLVKLASSESLLLESSVLMFQSDKKQWNVIGFTKANIAVVITADMCKSIHPSWISFHFIYTSFHSNWNCNY